MIARHVGDPESRARRIGSRRRRGASRPVRGRHPPPTASTAPRARSRTDLQVEPPDVHVDADAVERHPRAVGRDRQRAGVLEPAQLAGRLRAVGAHADHATVAARHAVDDEEVAAVGGPDRIARLPAAIGEPRRRTVRLAIGADAGDVELGREVLARPRVGEAGAVGREDRIGGAGVGRIDRGPVDGLPGDGRDQRDAAIAVEAHADRADREPAAVGRPRDPACRAGPRDDLPLRAAERRQQHQPGLARQGLRPGAARHVPQRERAPVRRPGRKQVRAVVVGELERRAGADGLGVDVVPAHALAQPRKGDLGCRPARRSGSSPSREAP